MRSVNRDQIVQRLRIWMHATLHMDVIMVVVPVSTLMLTTVKQLLILLHVGRTPTTTATSKIISARLAMKNSSQKTQQLTTWFRWTAVTASQKIIPVSLITSKEITQLVESTVSSYTSTTTRRGHVIYWQHQATVIYTIMF